MKVFSGLPQRTIRPHEPKSTNILRVLNWQSGSRNDFRIELIAVELPNRNEWHFQGQRSPHEVVPPLRSFRMFVLRNADFTNINGIFAKQPGGFSPFFDFGDALPQ